jgi:hypothetical protein
MPRNKRKGIPIINRWKTLNLSLGLGAFTALGGSPAPVSLLIWILWRLKLKGRIPAQMSLFKSTALFGHISWQQ